MCASETAEQVVVAQWLAARPHILSTAHPAGGYRLKSTGRLMQRLGLVPGVPDLLIFSRPPLMPDKTGVAIEMKRTVKPSWFTPEQREWVRRLNEAGWVAQVCRGAAVAIALLVRLGYDQPVETPYIAPVRRAKARSPSEGGLRVIAVGAEPAGRIDD